MLLLYYRLMFMLSLVLVALYTFFWHKRTNGHFTVMTILVPVINLGFLLVAQSQNLDEAITAVKLTYIGGCFLLLDTLFIVFNLCNITLNKWIRVGLILISSVIFLSALTIGHSNLFYHSVDFKIYDGVGVLYNKEYGIMHEVFYGMVVVYYLMMIGIIIYSFFKKKQIPRRLLMMICVPVTIAVIGFFGGRLVLHNIELLPLAYNAGMICYMFIVNKSMMYDPSDSIIEALVQKGDTGFISIDNSLRYLGSNESAKNMFPDLKDLIIDHSIVKSNWADKVLVPCIQAFKANSDDSTHHYNSGDKTYLITVNILKNGKKNRGYQLLIEDDTKNQQYIQLIQQYNVQLKNEVIEKTKNIEEMQEKLVLGMATMVEGRDNSTGGHIKRTSDGIKIIMNEIKKDNIVSDEFYNDIIKAAPMHDIGKITISDAILRKPGKYTEEEYAVMKTHAPEGARIIKQILEGTNDITFQRIAENVAHYHHEKWNGLGYPNGLKGEEIPLEARIMALADVYDALVSKRVYKEKFTFEEANKIILDGMGSHFDPNLEKYYVLARPKLEEYYTKSNLE